MRKRATQIAVAGLLLVALVWLVVWLSGPVVNPRNFHRIRSGISEQEIEALLGQGEECWNSGGQWPDRVGAPKQYNGEGYSIVVWYDADGRAVSKVDYNWIYFHEWAMPFRYKVRSMLWWYHHSVSEQSRR